MSGEEFAVVGTDGDGEWIVDPAFGDRKDAEACAARLNGKVVRRTVSDWVEVSR